MTRAAHDSGLVDITAVENTAAPSLHADHVSSRFREHISRDFARDHLIISQGHDDAVERLAVSESTDPAAVFNVGVRLQCRCETTIADAEAIAAIIDAAYEQADASNTETHDLDPNSSATGDAIEQLLAQADRDLLSTHGKGPIVKLVDALLFEALTRHASDVHVQSRNDRTLIRYRLDGVLQTVRELNSDLAGPLISRIKVMGRMDIAERRVPQDGRASVTIGNGDRARNIDLRISTMPTSYGERAVIRLLDHSNQLCDFDALGMPDAIARDYLDCARRANGIILITGPTGSGKTTSLYATLRSIGSDAVNIMTIEDPIEYDLTSTGLNISQSQVNEKKGVTFSSGLRHILRQDPDIVMVGEIRDTETARIAIQSSLTGHLVLSTLHTNDAASAITRLIDLGVEPYLVSASLSAVLAQRLVRRVHAPCNGRGCDDCFNQGYLGRCGIFELLTINESIRSLMTEHASVEAIRSTARQLGMRTLHEEGQRLIETGITTQLEVERVTQELV